MNELNQSRSLSVSLSHSVECESVCCGWCGVNLIESELHLVQVNSIRTRLEPFELVWADLSQFELAWLRPARFEDAEKNVCRYSCIHDIMLHVGRTPPYVKDTKNWTQQRPYPKYKYANQGGRVKSKQQLNGPVCKTWLRVKEMFKYQNTFANLFCSQPLHHTPSNNCMPFIAC